MGLLWGARKSCIKHISHLPGMRDEFMAEMFFQHTVVHAIDYVSFFQQIKGKAFPVSFEHADGGQKWNTWRKYLGRFVDRFIAQVFVFIIAQPTLTMTWDNMPRDSVYGKIHEDLKLLDSEWADVVCASISY